MKATPVRIAGMGVVSAAGVGRVAAAGTLAGDHPGPGRLDVFDTPLADRIAVSQVSDPLVPATERRNDRLALEAVRQALSEAGLAPGAPELADAALIVGTISGDAFESEKRYRRELAARGRIPCVTVEPTPGRMAERLAAALGIGGPVLTVCSACTSSANAALVAWQMLRAGRVPRAVVVGADVLTATLVHGFESLMLLDAAGCRPFDRERKGIQLGEAAGVVVLEPLSDPDGRDTRPLLLGGAARCDPYHMTASSPDGSGGAAVIEAACAAAGVAPTDIVAIKAHGTGTPDNDQAEGRALVRVWGDAIPPFTSLKRTLGHTMGAAGIVELATFAGCLEAGFVPRSHGFATPDPEIGAAPLTAPIPFRGGPILLNYFGFGGNSVSLVVRMTTPGGER
jgi:3-oxoacyl-(acyl-carrier-protein) synthase